MFIGALFVDVRHSVFSATLEFLSISRRLVHIYIYIHIYIINGERNVGRRYLYVLPLPFLLLKLFEF